MGGLTMARCRCWTGTLKNSTKCLWRGEPDLWSTFFFRPPAYMYLCSVTDKTEISLDVPLKLYCRYLYTRPCMINHIWGLKQLWLQVNGHAWFHLQRLRWPVRNGEGAKNSKWKYMSPAGFEPTPRHSTTGELQRLRPLGHAG